MILFYLIITLNFLAFWSVAYDKQLAIKKKRRIPERTLLYLVGFGGTIGSGLGMLVFKHKTSKESYLLKFWGITLIQILIFLGLFNFEILKL